MAKRPSDDDEPIQPGPPEWDRQITVNIVERGRWSPGVIKKCKACQEAIAEKRSPARCDEHDPRKKREVRRTETPENLDMFRMYRDAPEDRDSLAAIAKDRGFSLAKQRYMEQLSSAFRWPARREAKRAWDRAEEERKNKKAKRVRRGKLKTRLEKLQDELMDRGEKLIEEADKMRAYPFVETKVEKNGKVTIFKPVGWTRRDITRFYESALRLAEFAGELEGPDRILEGRVHGIRTTVAQIRSRTSTTAVGEAGADFGEGRLMEDVLTRVPSSILYEAYMRRLELEAKAEDAALHGDESLKAALNTMPLAADVAAQLDGKDVSSVTTTTSEVVMEVSGGDDPYGLSERGENLAALGELRAVLSLMSEDDMEAIERISANLRAAEQRRSGE